MGIGDLGVPTKMRKIGEAFYGRQAAYGAALGDRDHAALVGALKRNVFGAQPGSERGALRLAGYVRAVVDQLAGQDGEAFSRAAVAFPDPQTMMAADSMDAAE
jgi:cytochrome b pre-mRNA-processing protein 3